MGKKKDRIIPKRIGGVKLPKQLRKTGEALIQQATTPEGRATLMQGLSAAAAMIGAAQARPKPERAANDAQPAPVDPAKMVQTVGIVANEVLGKLFTGKR